jgi:hypothetical protein
MMAKAGEPRPWEGVGAVFQEGPGPRQGSGGPLSR